MGETRERRYLFGDEKLEEKRRRRGEDVVPLLRRRAGHVYGVGQAEFRFGFGERNPDSIVGGDFFLPGGTLRDVPRW
jgi:hypothetical protein